jgi:pSer/pThr/pTyr-binding forkhead associated (FHA) protein
MPRIVLKDLETQQTYAVSDIEATMGRDPACGFVIDGPKSKVVSGRHARIFFQDNGWWIEDTSRNGTVLDDERLQAGQRHALRVGQVLGLGESGPRFRVAALESRKVSETVTESPGLDAPAPPPTTTAPRRMAAAPPQAAQAPGASRGTDVNVTAMRRPEPQRSAVKFAEATEPMSPAPDWLVQVVLRTTTTNQRFDVTAMVVKIGRSPDSTVPVPPEMGASVSRLHAEIAISDGGVVVRDAGSRNGTFVNGKRIDSAHPVAKGDLLMLGSGGPTFSIDALHIVKERPPSPGRSGQGESTPIEPKRVKGKPLVEPPTDPSPIGEPQGVLKTVGTATSLAGRRVADAGRTAMLEDVLQDMPEKSARRVRMIIWAIVGVAVVIAAAIFLRSA